MQELESFKFSNPFADLPEDFFHKQNGIRGLENIIILSIFLNTKKIYHIKYNPNQLNLDNKKEIKKNKLFVYLFESILALLLMPIGILMTLFFFIFSLIKTKKN